MSTTCLRRMLYASQQYVLNFPKYALSVPPIASTISLHNFIGGGNTFGSATHNGSEVDVKHSSIWCHHQVVQVAVADSKYVSNDAISGAALDKNHE